MSHIESDRGWFLEQNLFDPVVAKAVRCQVNALLHRLRPVAVEMVDAYGIPDALLGSDIARSPELENLNLGSKGEALSADGADDTPPPAVGAATA